MKELNIHLAQLNATVGNIAGNLDKVRRTLVKARKAEADIILFPELFVSGYPPEDLVLKPAFVQEIRAGVEQLARELSENDPALVLGAPWVEKGELYNSVCFLHEGEIKAVRHKMDLPNYSVFDEKRVFTAGPLPEPVEFRGIRLGLPICEDIWLKGVHENISQHLAERGAELLLVANGSPWSGNKHEIRLQQARTRVSETGLPLIYVNQIGGQDELVFDGRSFVVTADQRVPLVMKAWQEQEIFTHWKKDETGWACISCSDTAPANSPQSTKTTALPLQKRDDKSQQQQADDYQACVLGLRDYVNKNRFPGVVLGLSGGIDSALCAAIAVDALGADKVHCVMLPYTYTSPESLKDAADCAKALGIRYDIVPVQEPVEAVNHVLADMFAGQKPDVTEENIQSRLRGVILMAISNKFGFMVVTTGNKSEMSVGYATLYGDMNGGFNPIKDMYKTRVYQISAWRNAHLPEICRGPAGEVIPENIITKAPSAELRPDQTDQDSLPPYDILDDILHGLIEEELSAAEIIARGHVPETVQRIQHLLYIAEYKRRQSAPGVKLSTRNFGRDRRYPITNAFRDRVEKT